MRAELRDKFLNRLDELASWAGAPDFENAIKEFRRILTAFLERTEPMKSKEDFRKLLDEMPDPSFGEEKLILGSIRLIPQVLRYGIKVFAKMAERELPALPTGRPPIEYQTRAEIVAYIGGLNLRGASLEACKTRAARKFDCSVSTIERIWAERAQIEEVDFRSALRWWIETTEKNGVEVTRNGPQYELW